MSSQAQGSSQQAIISSKQILSEFDLIEESENPISALRQFLEKNPQVLEHQFSGFENLIFYAIYKNKIKTLGAILKANPEVLNQENPPYGSPVFFAINLNNIEALKLILEANPEVLNQENPPYGSPVFYAIDKNNIEALKLILETNPEVLNQENPPYGNPVFFAINENNIEALKLILEANPEVLNQENPPYGSPVFYAIDKNNIEALKLILKANPGVLNQENPPYGNPVFFAIKNGKLASLKHILDHHPDELKKTQSDKDPFESSLMQYLEAKQSDSQEEIDSEKSIVNAIYQAQLKTKANLDEEDFKSLEVFIKKFSHLKLGYSDEKFGIKDSLKKTIYQELLASRSSLGQPKDSDQFRETSLSTLKSIDNFESPIATSKEKLFIFSSDLQKHCSYFVFHVNSNNNLTGISYCDGNNISSNQISIFNRNYLKGGVSMFKLDSEIKFSKEFVDEFLDLNSKFKDIYEFYRQLSNEGLKVVDPQNPSSIQFLSISDNSKLDYEIPTKEQERGNCGLKSKSILDRYVAKLQNPKLSFSAGLNTPSSLMQLWSTQIDGRSLFKQFKGQLTIDQVEDLLKLKQDLSEADQHKPFNQFLSRRIDKILFEVNKKAKKKIEKKQGIFKPKDLAIHQRIAQLTEGSTKTEIEELPRASCFDGIAKRLGLYRGKNKINNAKIAIPRTNCFSAIASRLAGSNKKKSPSIQI